MGEWIRLLEGEMAIHHSFMYSSNSPTHLPTLVVENERRAAQCLRILTGTQEVSRLDLRQKAVVKVLRRESRKT